MNHDGNPQQPVNARWHDTQKIQFFGAVRAGALSRQLARAFGIAELAYRHSRSESR